MRIRHALKSIPTRRARAPLAITVTTALLLGMLGTVPAQAAPEPPGPPAAAEDRGPGPKAPPGAPYAREDKALADAEAKARAEGAPEVGGPVELPGMRTQNSATVQDPVTGELTTQISAESLNYREDGQWVPIDNALAPTDPGKPDTGYENGANRFDAEFPADLTDAPVTVADAANPQRQVSLQLDTDQPATPPAPSAPAPSTPAPSDPAPRDPAPGAPEPSVPAPATAAPSAPAPAAAVEDAPPAVVEGDTVAYPDAVGTGIDVSYQVLPDGVKESITLDTPAAAAGLAGGAVSFTLDVGKGLTPVLDGEVVRVVDEKKATVFVIPAPFMDDAAGAHSEDVAVALAKDGDAWTLTLTPDAGWLAAAERKYPVVVDPTISFPSAMVGCWLKSTTPSTSACSNSVLPVAWDSNDGTQERALLRFDTLLDVVPADALLSRAVLQVNVRNNGGVASSVDVREATSAWTSGATWNTRTGSTAWATPGGDRATLVSARGTLTPNGTTQDLEVGELVTRWVEGSSPHNGFVIEKTAAAPFGQTIVINSPSSASPPSLFVDWQPRTGVRKANTAAVEINPTDRTSVSVNPATGNAAVSTSEFSIAGVGLNFELSHTSNSLDTAFLGPLGYGWSSSAGGTAGARLNLRTWGVQYTDGTGGRYMFFKAIDGSYVRPMGLDADLVANPNGTFTLTERQSKVAQTFTGIGGVVYGLSTVADRNGNTITFTYDPTATLSYNGVKILRSVTDTRGRVHTIANGGSWNSSTTDSANRSVMYYVVGNELDYVDAGPGNIDYDYDAAHRVTSILSPEDHKVTMAYDSTGRITQLTRVDNPGAGTGPTWTFAYNPYTRTNGVPSTTTAVTDPNGNVTTYTSDGRGRVSRVTDARGKNRDTTYSPNDDIASSTLATPGAGGAASTTTNTYNPGSFTLASTRIPTGAQQAFTYGTGARLYDPLTGTDSRGNATTYTYNTNGETTSVTRGGTTTRYLYQGDTDPAYGGTVNCGPTVSGNVTATKTGVLCEERDALYVAGSSAAATTAHRTAYRYDALGQLTTLIPAGTAPGPIVDGKITTGTSTTGRGVQTFTYDELSRLETVVDGKGQWTFTAYDELDRRVYVMHNDGSTESYFVTDDGPVRQLTEYNPAEVMTRQTDYNRNPELVDRIQQIVAPEGNIGFDYDGLGRLVGYEDTGGYVTYGYNVANQLTSIAEPGGTCSGQSYASPGAASTKCILFRVDDDGARTGVRYPGGATQTWALDGSGRPTQITGTAGGATQLSLALTYTDATVPADPGNPNKDTQLVKRIVEGSSATDYAYDALDRLTVANTLPAAGGATTGWESFCYDAAGNRTKTYTTAGLHCASSSPTTTATYDAANQLTALTGTGLTGTGFSYDANGNQTSAISAPGRTATYNDRDQVTSTTPTGGTAAASTYAATGNLERLTAGSTTFQPSPLSPAPARSASGDTSTWTVRDPDGALIAIRVGLTATPASATSYYPFTDQVGAVRTMVTTTGTIAAAYTYTAYGTTKTATGPIATTNPYRYGQGYTDTNTGLIKLGARYYDTTTGRFTQTDPSGQEANPYLYTGANPVNFVDPTGLIFDPLKNAKKFFKKLIPGSQVVCFISESAAEGDTNSVSDDFGDLAGCLNPFSVAGDAD